jgi:hypothetical protein
VVARDIAHAKLQERIDRGEGLPQYMKDHPVYYAGPAKTPDGMASGSFGPTTAGRMDTYVDSFQVRGRPPAPWPALSACTVRAPNSRARPFIVICLSLRALISRALPPVVICLSPPAGRGWKHGHAGQGQPQ